MTDYTKTFGNPFTTRHHLTDIKPMVQALEHEIGQNMAPDHWHPEVAGALQLAVHYLQTRGKEER